MAQLKDTTINGSLEVSNRINLPNTVGIAALDTDGEYRQNIQPCNANNNCVIGYPNYNKADGNTNIYGNHIYMYSAAAGNTGYRPYYTAGDSITFELNTAGYVTTGGASIRFFVPLSKPIIGSPTVTITSGSGMTIRQNGQYTHGSSSSASVKPQTYSTIGSTGGNGIVIVATMNQTTNVTNNDSLGVYWHGTITFS